MCECVCLFGIKYESLSINPPDPLSCVSSLYLSISLVPPSPLPLFCVFVQCCSMCRDRVNADTNTCSLKVTQISVTAHTPTRTHTETHPKPPTFAVRVSVSRIPLLKHTQLLKTHRAQSLLHSLQLSCFVLNALIVGCHALFIRMKSCPLLECLFACIINTSLCWERKQHPRS